MLARATLPTLRKGFRPHGSPPSCLSARGPPSRGADSARARACTATAARRRHRHRHRHRHRRRSATVAAAAVATAAAASLGSVGFLGTPSSAGITQQVVQQGGEATVWLQGYTGGGPLQVQVATDPSSPAVGVNLPAVNQTVTIPGERQPDFASVTIPTNAGAPNPGEVDVNLTITPIDPPTGVTVQGGPLELRILAPDATTPPKIIGVAGTPNGIQLMFSKPMNPVQASNVHNYAVRETFTTISGKDDFLGSPSQFSSPDDPTAAPRPRFPQSRCVSARQSTTPQISR